MKSGFYLTASGVISERSHISVNDNEVDYCSKEGKNSKEAQKLTGRMTQVASLSHPQQAPAVGTTKAGGATVLGVIKEAFGAEGARLILHLQVRIVYIGRIHFV